MVGGWGGGCGFWGGGEGGGGGEGLGKVEQENV